ncbi:MAG: hypothetical protein ABMA64_39675 [Myxococcota bacterium]
MFLRTFPVLHVRLDATSVTEMFRPLTKWYHTTEALTVLSTVLVLSNKNGNFQCRLGIQTATVVTDDANNPLNPASAPTQVSTAPNRSLLRFDPNGATDGNIDAAMYFRIGVFYSLSSGSTPAQGDVRLEGLSWR